MEHAGRGHPQLDRGLQRVSFFDRSPLTGFLVSGFECAVAVKQALGYLRETVRGPF